MPVSSIPAFKAALVALLQANAVLTASGETMIVRGWPQKMPTKEVVVVDNTRLRERAPVIASGLYREERYTQSIFISVRRPGTDAQGCEERAFTLMSGVEQVIRPEFAGSLTVSGTVMKATFSGGTADTSPTPDGSGYATRIPCTLEVLARI